MIGDSSTCGLQWGSCCLLTHQSLPTPLSSPLTAQKKVDHWELCAAPWKESTGWFNTTTDVQGYTPTQVIHEEEEELGGWAHCRLTGCEWPSLEGHSITAHASLGMSGVGTGGLQPSIELLVLVYSLPLAPTQASAVVRRLYPCPYDDKVG